MKEKTAIVMLTNNEQLLNLILKHSEKFDVDYKIEFVFDGRINGMNEEKINRICKRHKYFNYDITNGNRILEWFNNEAATHYFMSLNILCDLYFLNKYDKIIRTEDDIFVDNYEQLKSFLDLDYKVITQYNWWGGKPSKTIAQHLGEITDVFDLDYSNANENRINGGIYILHKDVYEYYFKLVTDFFNVAGYMFYDEKYNKQIRMLDELILTVVRKKFDGLNAKTLSIVKDNNNFKTVKPSKNKATRHYAGKVPKEILFRLLELEEFNDIKREQ